MLIPLSIMSTGATSWYCTVLYGIPWETQNAFSQEEIILALLTTYEEICPCDTLFIT